MFPTALIADLLAFIAADRPSDDAFDRQALALFAHQYLNNVPFRRFCQQRGKTLRTVKNWRDIPAVPISAFKALSLSCIPASEAERTFMTSGTTQAEVKENTTTDAGRHDASMIRILASASWPAAASACAGICPDEALLPNLHWRYLALAVRGRPRGSHYCSQSKVWTGACDRELEPPGNRRIYACWARVTALCIAR